MSLIVEPINSIGLEIRPGFLIAGEEFMGWEVGTFVNYRIPKSSFSILIGINHLFKTQTGGNNRGSEGGYFPFYGIGFGYNQNENIRIDLSYFITSRKEYASYRYYDYSSLKVLHYKKKYNWCTKNWFKYRVQYYTILTNSGNCAQYTF